MPSLWEKVIPPKYDAPVEFHTFVFNGRAYPGGSNIDDKSSIYYKALDYGFNFIEILRAYYKKLYKIELPAVKLFIIESSSINAFAVYEKSLNSFCIGIFAGACDSISHYAQETYDAIVEKDEGLSEEEKLIPNTQKQRWVEHVEIEALKFFVAHEYAHIVCGHVGVEVDPQKCFEFFTGEKSESENLLQQMKEFEADQVAMMFLSGMAYQNNDTIREVEKNESFIALNEENDQLRSLHLPERMHNEIYATKLNGIFATLDANFHERVVSDLKFLMAGTNVVFYLMDQGRRDFLHSTFKSEASTSECDNFFIMSGLASMRKIDHPLPAIRIDAVVRILDETIENFECAEEVEDICKSVADYSWKVEECRNNFCRTNIYRLIAYTPTAQNYIQEMENLWQEKKSMFPSTLPKLQRLFYKNRLVYMTDDGKIIDNRK